MSKELELVLEYSSMAKGDGWKSKWFTPNIYFLAEIFSAFFWKDWYLIESDIK